MKISNCDTVNEENKIGNNGKNIIQNNEKL